MSATRRIKKMQLGLTYRCCFCWRVTAAWLRPHRYWLNFSCPLWGETVCTILSWPNKCPLAPSVIFICCTAHLNFTATTVNLLRGPVHWDSEASLSRQHTTTMFPRGYEPPDKIPKNILAAACSVTLSMPFVSELHSGEICIRTSIPLLLESVFPARSVEGRIRMTFSPVLEICEEIVCLACEQHLYCSVQYNSTWQYTSPAVVGQRGCHLRRHPRLPFVLYWSIHEKFIIETNCAFHSA